MQLYNKSAESAITDFCANVPILTVTILVVHGVVNVAGLMFSDSDVLRQENDHLLNDLEEGLVIFENDTGYKVLFENKAAQQQTQPNDVQCRHL